MSWRCARAITRYQEGTKRIPAIRLRRIFTRCGNFATNGNPDVIRSRSDSCRAGRGQSVSGGLVMRTAVSNAASPRHLHWQAAFTTKAYQTSSPVLWQHVFVSDTHMTNWSGGSSLFLHWAAEKRPPGKRRPCTSRVIAFRQLFRSPPL